MIHIEVHQTNREAQKALGYISNINKQILKKIIGKNVHLTPVKTPPITLAYVVQLQAIEMDGECCYDFYEKVFDGTPQKVYNDSSTLEEMTDKINLRLAISRQSLPGVSLKPYFYTIQCEGFFDVTANRSLVHYHSLDTAIMPTSILFRGLTENERRRFEKRF